MGRDKDAIKQKERAQLKGRCLPPIMARAMRIISRIMRSNLVGRCGVRITASMMQIPPMDVLKSTCCFY